MRIIPKYIRSKFIFQYLFLIIAIIILFLVLDLVENLDKFIDKRVSTNIIIQYYLYYIPYIIILVMPMATLMATVFSLSSLAKHNEIIAFKALGMSMFQIIKTMLSMGVMLSIAAFFIAETLAIPANRKMLQIKNEYLDRNNPQNYNRIRNIQIQEPPDKVVTIGYYDKNKKIAKHVTVETFRDNKLISRLDAPSMERAGNAWVIKSGVQRIFQDDREHLTNIEKPLIFPFKFTPRQIVLAQLKPDEMNFSELAGFIRRVRESGGETFQWLTDLHFRISFPASNLVIMLFSIPLVYNRRQKSLAAGFGISLAVSFVYFGLVKIGETMGHKGTANPIIAAWLGNLIMIASGIIFTLRARK
ncbi:LptF/LptG family permease [bacterium]|nr:LptF/LptG family permease [bacterium]